MNFFFIIRTHFNWFCHDDSKCGFKFRSIMLIKRRFDHEISRCGNLDRLQGLSLLFITSRLVKKEMWLMLLIWIELQAISFHWIWYWTMLFRRFAELSNCCIIISSVIRLNWLRFWPSFFRFFKADSWWRHARRGGGLSFCDTYVWRPI